MNCANLYIIDIPIFILIAIIFYTIGKNKNEFCDNYNKLTKPTKNLDKPKPNKPTKPTKPTKNLDKPKEGL